MWGMIEMKSPVNTLAALGLALGAVFGLAGAMTAQSNLQATLWAIDSVGLVMASALLALKFFKKEREIVAAGFLVFAIGEGALLSETAAGAIGSVPSFGAGTALWATALLLISTPREFPIWVRLVGIATSILFAIIAERIFWGEQLLPTASPRPFFAYPFLVITFVGWISELLREKTV
jgi:hypothetical protein